MTSDKIVFKTLFDKTDKVRTQMSKETLGRAVMAGGIVVRNAAILNIGKTFKKVTGARGGLSKIIVVVSESTDTKATVDIGPTAIYGRIHELGGVIRAVKAKYLCIPMNGAKGSPRQYSGLHFINIDGSTGLLIDDAGVVKFFLTKVVHMPARPYLKPAMADNKEKIRKAMAEAIEQGIKEALS